MKRSDLYEKQTYSREELCSGNWIASRGFDVFEKADEYKAQVIERLHRAAGALHSAGIPYAVVGGNGVATWVASVDPGAIRSTKDVDILLRREDLDKCIKALETVGFLHQHRKCIHYFLDGPASSPRAAVFLLFVGEKVHPENMYPAPDLNDVQLSDRGFYITSLKTIVRMKLISNRLIDQVHLQDMISVGLIDATWMDTLPPELAPRLKHLLDNPE